ncbi:hypothetical protein KCP69_10045 [Salmonella enterica subsp. enterica]|nr:hypothetical protein KCP69_10045 [Salmonella enterica subsp. enterica]
MSFSEEGLSVAAIVHDGRWYTHCRRNKVIHPRVVVCAGSWAQGSRFVTLSLSLVNDWLLGWFWIPF